MCTLWACVCVCTMRVHGYCVGACVCTMWVRVHHVGACVCAVQVRACVLHADMHVFTVQVCTGVCCVWACMRVCCGAALHYAYVHTQVYTCASVYGGVCLWCLCACV